MSRLISVLCLSALLVACGSGAETEPTDENTPIDVIDPKVETESPDSDDGSTPEEFVWSILNEEEFGSLNTTDKIYQEHFFTVDVAANIRVVMIPNNGIDFDLALYDAHDMLLAEANTVNAESITMNVVPGTYRVRVINDSQESGEYRLTMGASRRSTDGNDTWLDASSLDGTLQDELATFSENYNDTFDFFTFTLLEDSYIYVNVTQGEGMHYRLGLYSDSKKLFFNNLHYSGSPNVGGAYLAGTYYVVVDSSKSDVFGAYTVGLVEQLLDGDELSSFDNPIPVIAETNMNETLNAVTDNEDIYSFTPATAGQYNFSVSIGNVYSDEDAEIYVYDSNRVLIDHKIGTGIIYMDLDVATYYIKVKINAGLGRYIFHARYLD
jgi:hypothetical protein